MPFTNPSEAYISGQGGHVIPTGVANAQSYPVTEWRLRKTARLAEAITSASGGEQRVNVLRGGQIQFNVPWNATAGQTPETRGFTEGSTGQVGLILGNGVLWYVFLYIIESVEIISNTTNDVIRLTISGYVQGTVPNPTTVPA